MMAFEAKTGKQLWAKKTKVSPLTMSANDSQTSSFHDGTKLVSAWTGRTGDQWFGKPSRSPVASRSRSTSGRELVLYEDVVLYAGGDGKMTAYDAKSGDETLGGSAPTAVINRRKT